MRAPGVRIGGPAYYSHHGYTASARTPARSIPGRRAAARPGGQRQAPRRLPALPLALGEHAGRRTALRVLQLPDAGRSDGPLEARPAAVGDLARTPRAAESGAQVEDRRPRIRAPRPLAALTGPLPHLRDQFQRQMAHEDADRPPRPARNHGFSRLALDGGNQRAAPRLRIHDEPRV